MSCCSESKIRAGGRDRVRKLPDAVLYRIRLVLVPKDAVRTSTLSTRWKDIWASVPNLNFDSRDFSSSTGFSEFVYWVLFFRESTSIKKFRVFYSLAEDFSQDFSHADGWIRTAIRQKVAELDLLIESDDGEMLLLPFEPVVVKVYG